MLSKIINYYKWKALISFLVEKEKKNTEGKKKRKKICAFATPRPELSPFMLPSFPIQYTNALS